MKRLLRISTAGILMVSLIVLGLVTVPGCTEELTPEEAKTELCASLAELQTQVARLGTLTPQSTVDDVKAIGADIQTAYDDVQSKAEQVAEVNVNELQQAYQDLDAAIEGIPGDATVPEALAVIETQWTAVNTAWQDVIADANCGEQPAETPAEGSPAEGTPAEETPAEETPEESP